MTFHFCQRRLEAAQRLIENSLSGDLRIPALRDLHVAGLAAGGEGAGNRVWGAVVVHVGGEGVPFEHAGFVEFEAEQPAEFGLPRL